MGIYAYLIAAAVLAASGFAGGWNVRAWKADSDNASRVKQEIAQQQANAFNAASVSTQYEVERAQRDVKTKVITKEVIRVVQADPVYRNECISPDGLQLVARALGPAAAASEPSPAMPAASTSH